MGFVQKVARDSGDAYEEVDRVARMVTICVAPAGQRGALAHFKKLVWVLEGLFGLAPCFAEGNQEMPYFLICTVVL